MKLAERFRSLTTWMALAIYAFTGLVPVHGFVLCVGPEGHCTIELATLEGACFDCSPANVAEDPCCASNESPSVRSAHDPASDCVCTDLLIFVGQSQPGIVLTNDPIDRTAPPVSRPTPAIELAPQHGFELLMRGRPPRVPRVSSNLVLRN